MLDRDARGWVLTACSALACCAGAAIIFIDLLPWKTFSIQSNPSFLAACLSLSFAVLSFSAARLFGEAVNYIDRDFNGNAYYVVLGAYSSGFIVCYYLFKFLHRFVPHRTVNCDEDRNEVDGGEGDENDNDDPDKASEESGYGSAGSQSSPPANGGSSRLSSKPTRLPDEETALLRVPNGKPRPGLAKRLTSTMAKVTRRCTEDGRCYGFITCPCEGKCLHKKDGSSRSFHACRPNHCERSVSSRHSVDGSERPSGRCVDDCSGNATGGCDQMITAAIVEADGEDGHHHHEHGHSHSKHGQEQHQHKQSHHHHVANNAFVGIGFQTSLAIALHRCPDGFITFVTNHADKQLGFTIFLSLFIHSAVDGFTMCLPLYLATQSAWKAVLITFLVGGLAQPLGGLIAYIWLKVGSTPSETVYGIIFGVTAGLMSVVAVQLLRQIPSDHNHPDLPYVSMLVGIALMILSVALTT